jgi:hypothetical protein
MVRLILIALLLVGCSAQPVRDITTNEIVVTRMVPISAKCPTPPSFDLPELPISKLGSDPSIYPPDMVAKYWVATVEVLKREMLFCKGVIDSYR